MNWNEPIFLYELISKSLLLEHAFTLIQSKIILFHNTQYIHKIGNIEMVVYACSLH